MKLHLKTQGNGRVRSAAVLGSSNVSAPKRGNSIKSPPRPNRLRPRTGPEDGRTPPKQIPRCLGTTFPKLNTHSPQWRGHIARWISFRVVRVFGGHIPFLGWLDVSHDPEFLAQ